MKKMDVGDGNEEFEHGRTQLVSLDVECFYEIECVDLVTEVRSRNEDTMAGTSTLKSQGLSKYDAYNISRVGDVDANRVKDISGSQSMGDGENRIEADFRLSGSTHFPLETSELPRMNGSRSRSPVFFQPEHAFSSDKVGEKYFVDIPVREVSKIDDGDNIKGFTIDRTTSNFSVESSSGDQCRICQQHTDEALMELGCHCRGELANAHRSCVDRWFGNKGTNKCEVCQHVATNVPLPASQPTPHFWVWRVGGGAFNSAASRRTGARFHPLWAALLILIAGLLFDILISIFLGASALPVNIIIG